MLSNLANSIWASQSPDLAVQVRKNCWKGGTKGWRQRRRERRGFGGQGQGMWTLTSSPTAAAAAAKKPSLRLQVIITAACYQEETSDLRSSAPLLLPLFSPSPWDADKSAVSVSPPYMRFAANYVFYSTLPLLFLLFHPSPHSLAHTTHCIHIFKCKIKLLLCSLAASPLNPPPCCDLLPPPPSLSLSFSLDIAAWTPFQ